MRSPRVIVGLALLAGVGAVPAVAQNDASSTDPQAGSPAGVLYEIPLDTARRDSAPRRGGRQGGGADPGSRAPSSIHSENGFGSSSTVPGAGGPAGGDEAGGSQERGGSEEGTGGAGGSGAGGGERDSSGGQLPEAAVLSADAPGPGLDAYGLVGMLGLLAAGVGIVAGRAFRRPPG